MKRRHKIYVVIAFCFLLPLLATSYFLIARHNNQRAFALAGSVCSSISPGFSETSVRTIAHANDADIVEVPEGKYLVFHFLYADELGCVVKFKDGIVTESFFTDFDD